MQVLLEARVNLSTCLGVPLRAMPSDHLLTPAQVKLWHVGAQVKLAHMHPYCVHAAYGPSKPIVIPQLFSTHW